MQVADQQPTKSRLYNWEALRQLEREREWLSHVAAGLGAVSFVSGVIASPGFLLLAAAYRPLIRATKISRIIEVMRTLLEAFGDQLQIYPCIDVPGAEPLDLLVIAPEKAYILNAEIERLNYKWEAFREPGQRTEEDSSRLPDVMVVPLAAIETVLNHEGLGAAKYIGFPKAPTVTVYELVNSKYQANRFRGAERIESPTSKDLNLTAHQVFLAGRNNL
jgi:hypothetical protein